MSNDTRVGLCFVAGGVLCLLAFCAPEPMPMLPTLPARPTVSLAAPLPAIQEPINTTAPVTVDRGCSRGITGEWTVCR